MCVRSILSSVFRSSLITAKGNNELECYFSNVVFAWPHCVFAVSQSMPVWLVTDNRCSSLSLVRATYIFAALSIGSHYIY